MDILNYLIKKYYQLIYKDKLISNTTKSVQSEQDYVMTSFVDYPESFSIKHSLPIRSQGGIGSCMSHAAIRAVEMQINQKNFVEGSELHHYFMARKHVNKTYPANKGMSVADGCRTLRVHGFCPEKVWKYITKDYNKTPDTLAESFTDILKHHYKFSYYRVIDVDGIKSAISNGLPVVFGLRIDTNYMKGKYVWTPGGSYKGGHAQIITKYDEDYFYMENSWGKRWGSGGVYKAKISDVMSKGFDFMVIKLED